MFVPRKRKRVTVNTVKRSTAPHLSHDRHWTTSDEMAFIAGLGTYTRDRQLAPRAVLLQRYREAMALRQHWGDIDEVRILAAVREALQESNDAYSVAI